MERTDQELKLRLTELEPAKQELTEQELATVARAERAIRQAAIIQPLVFACGICLLLLMAFDFITRNELNYFGVFILLMLAPRLQHPSAPSYRTLVRMLAKRKPADPLINNLTQG